MTRFGPKDRWPRHGEDRWNELLALARSKGWTFTKFTAHRFGQIECPAKECYFPPIDTSATGTESFVKHKRRIVERCPHGEVNQTDIVVRLRQHLTEGERLIDAADRLAQRDASHAEIADLWEAANTSLSDADDDLIVAKLGETDWWADEHDTAAADLLAGTPLEGEGDPQPVVLAADEKVVEADEELAQMSPGHDDLAALQQRTEDLRRRVESMRVQVGLGPSDRH